MMVSSAIETSIEDLPFEVLEMIMTYLNPSDRRDASCVNKRFLEAASNTSKIVIRFERCHLDDNCEPLKTFLESPRKFTRIFMDKVTFGESLDQFGRHFGPTVTELKINCKQDNNKLNAVILLKHMKALRVLEIHCGCSMSSFASFLNDKLGEDVLKLELILDLLPNLEVLYCIVDGNEVQAALRRCRKLKEFHCIRSRTELTNMDLNVGISRLTFPLRINAQKCEVFLNANKQLIQLGQSSTTKKADKSEFCRAKVSVEAFSVIQRVLPDLEVLNVTVVDDVDYQHDLDFLCFFPNLRYCGWQVINIANPFTFSTEDHKLHKLTVNRKMKYLQLSHVNNPCQLCFNRLFTSFPNLRCLDLNTSELNDTILHVIFKNLPLLRVLDISDCEDITDAGIIGLVGGVLKPAHSLSNLKGLRVLNMLGCTELTDVSVVSLELPELLKLRMTEFTCETPVETTKALVHNCPAIECLTLSFNGINDDCVKVLAQNLRRLKRLNLASCLSGLTMTAWDHVDNYCRNLRYLCMNYISYFNSKRKVSFSNVKTLRCVEDGDDTDDDDNSY